MPLLTVNDQGLYCAAGQFHVDPWRAVDHALITHAHSDHARPGSRHYLCASPGRDVLAERVGPQARIEAMDYGCTRTINGVRVSFHPAGHLLGSAQVRLEHRGETWVVSGDYKTEPDATCAPFQPVRCHVFVTESTFGLPIYRWRPAGEVLRDVVDWWRANQSEGRTSVLFAYALGKAQRLLHGLRDGVGPLGVHGAVERFLAAYRAAGVALPETRPVQADTRGALRGRGLVVAPPSAANTPWIRKLGPASTAFASGWMQVRGARRWRSADRGFVISDHADWPGLLEAIRATEAERILVTHGYVAVMVRWLREQGWTADPLQTRFVGGEEDEAA